MIRLPSTINKLVKLQSLRVSKNDIEILPQELAGLSQLRTLQYGSNNCYEIPRWIGKLISLRKLFVDDNNISTLPEELGHLKALIMLDLRGNELVKINLDILSEMTSLRELYVKGNPLEKEARTELTNFCQKNKILLDPSELDYF